MNIETANRLFQYRKKRGLSQEGLAEKIGVSRQAVSKWERAEASPDTDNLIALAKVYGVTLDDLLTGGEAEIAAAPSSESHVPEESRDYKYQREPEGFSAQEEEDDYNYVKAEINIDDDFPGYEKRDDAHIFHFEVAKRKKDFWHKLPVPIIAVIVFFIWGFSGRLGGWATSWIVFLAIPIYYTLVDAIIKRKPSHFAYPVLVTAVYMFVGMIWYWWHPGWLLYLTVPVYYGICDMFKTEPRSK